MKDSKIQDEPKTIRMSLQTNKKLDILKLLLSENKGDIIEKALNALIEKDNISYVDEMIERSLNSDKKNKNRILNKNK